MVRFYTEISWVIYWPHLIYTYTCHPLIARLSFVNWAQRVREIKVRHLGSRTSFMSELGKLTIYDCELDLTPTQLTKVNDERMSN